MDFAQQRRRMVDLLRREIKDKLVLEAMGKVAREEFVPEAHRHLAYEDMALPIEEGQAISQPLMVAVMVAALGIKPKDKVMEVGAGSGYQTAVLSLLAREVVATERIPLLVEVATARLSRLGYANVHVRPAGEALGCPEEAPYDGIVVAAGGPLLPRDLLDQLAEGGRLVIPVGSRLEQQLMKVTKNNHGYFVQTLGGCRFVPLFGKGAWDDDQEGEAGG